jgi:ACS family pantothenate transporter-like MFS transporter
MWNNVINAWWPLIFYPATDAPKFQKGMYAMIGVCVATLVVTWAVWWLEKREKRQAEHERKEEQEAEADRTADRGSHEKVRR